MKALLLLSVLITLSSSALARIGETREQCDARYGKPVEVIEKTQTVAYEKAGLRIECTFYENKCDSIYFIRLEKDAKGKGIPFPEDEKRILLEANSGGKPWIKVPTPGVTSVEDWECTDQDLSALCFTEDDIYLSITTKALRERRKARREAAEKEKSKLKDF
jgi:hypothetical protein